MKIKKGKILLYRVFDIGEEINIEKAEAILEQFQTGRSKFKVKEADQQSFVVNQEALIVSMGQHQFELPNATLPYDLNGKVWEFGTFSLTFEIKIPEDVSFKELNNFYRQIVEHKNIDDVAKSKSKELTGQIASAMNKTNQWDVNEDYTIFFIEEIEGLGEDASVLLNQEDIAALILSENENALSKKISERLIDSAHQYYKNDLAVIDWNSALIIEPTGQREIADVIEFALNQLLELRYYDDLLDKKLNQIYSAVELKNQNIFSNKYSDLAQEAAQRYIEIAEIVETVENSIKIIGDLYFSTIFRSASKKFRFENWQSNIDNKLNNLAEISKLLNEGINHKRSQLIEIIIAVLIIIETARIFI